MYLLHPWPELKIIYFNTLVRFNILNGHMWAFKKIIINLADLFLLYKKKHYTKKILHAEILQEIF